MGALLLSPAAVQAQQPSPAQEAAGDRRAEIARDLFERGKAKWLEGQFEAAAALLAASDEQLSVPSTLALLADSYEHLGRLKSASDTFHRAAALATERNNLALAHSAGTREAALRPRMPQLEIRVAAPVPAGLLVTLNGVEVPGPLLNAPIAMDAGSYQLEARAPGHLPSVSSVRLLNDRTQPTGPQIASVMLAPEPSRPAPSAAVPRPDTRGENRREVAWWLAAGGAAALVTGGIVMLVSWAKYADSRQLCTEATGSSRQCPRGAFEERNTSLQLAGVATGVGLTGVALLGTGITLYFTPVQAPESVAPVGAGMGLRGAF
ncbi:MAG: hypothetical protein ABI895_26680 [Deltaproteobacteria bacterium]